MKKEQVIFTFQHEKKTICKDKALEEGDKGKRIHT